MYRSQLEAAPKLFMCSQRKFVGAASSREDRWHFA